MSKEVLAALIGAGLGGLIALVGTLLSAIFENRRRLAEAQRRDVEWRREKCNEAYSQAIYYLFELFLSAAGKDASDTEVRQQISEAQRYLSLLQAYHPSEEQRRALGQAAEKLRAGTDGPGGIRQAAAAAREVVEASLQLTWSPGIRSPA